MEEKSINFKNEDNKMNNSENNTKYYFESYNLQTRYCTIWHGFLKYDGIQIPINREHILSTNNKLLYNIDLSDIFTEICQLNFYISLIDNYIYISHDMDEFYYYYQFEKSIKNAIKETELKFNIVITNGEFYANEIKHNGNQYKYTISKKDDKIILKKKILNWDSNNSKKVKNKEKDEKDKKDLLSISIKNMKI
jgi:hypothetical protein